MKRFLSIFLMALLLLTSCADTTAEVTDPSWEEYQQSQPDKTPEKPSLSFPSSFSLAYHKDHTLSPFTCGEGIQQDVSSLLYEPLFRLDHTFAPTPLLCESYSWDESGLVCTLTIRSGILFSDGSELTAADAAASLRCAAASQRYSYRLRQVASITSNRSGQVILTLTAPNRGLISLLDIPVVKQSTEDQIAPVGTGPYVIVTGSNGVHLQANSDWWQHRSLPVAVIPLVQAKDQDTAAYLFSSRRIELLTVDPTDHTTFSGQTEETSQPAPILQFIGFNTRSGVFAATDARKAFCQGLPRQMLADAFLSGQPRRPSSPSTPTLPFIPLIWSSAAATRMSSLPCVPPDMTPELVRS